MEEEDHGVLSMPDEVSAEDFIGAGNSGICFRYPGTNIVIKIPLTDSPGEEYQRCQIEAGAYERMANTLNRPASILAYYGKTPYGIQLAYAAHGSIRQYRSKSGQVSPDLVCRWAEQAVEALVFCHDECSILHADINCRNFFIDEGFNLCLADFAGSSIDSAPALVGYSPSHQSPYNSSVDNGKTRAVTVQTEIFAFGSFLYELVTGTAPPATNGVLEHLPDVSRVPLGNVMAGCWKHRFKSMKEVQQRIRNYVHLR